MRLRQPRLGAPLPQNALDSNGCPPGAQQDFSNPSFISSNSEGGLNITANDSDNLVSFSLGEATFKSLDDKTDDHPPQEYNQIVALYNIEQNLGKEDKRPTV